MRNFNSVCMCVCVFHQMETLRVGRMLGCKKYFCQISLTVLDVGIIHSTWHSATLILQWRHNERDVVSNHRRPDCLLSRLFRRRSKNTLKLRVTGLFEGNSPVTVEFPAQRTITQKMLPFDDVIMNRTTRNSRVSSHQWINRSHWSQQ